MKPKEALVKDGFLPPGSENVRGRLSGAAIERCKELAAQGWNIEGYQSKAGESGVATVEKVKVATGSKEIADIGHPIHDEYEWEAYGNDGGVVKDIGMRTVCLNCNSSLTYCPCKTPRVWLDFDRTVLVNFRLRRTPLSNKRW